MAFEVITSNDCANPWSNPLVSILAKYASTSFFCSSLVNPSVAMVTTDPNISNPGGNNSYTLAQFSCNQLHNFSIPLRWARNPCMGM